MFQMDLDPVGSEVTQSTHAHRCSELEPTKFSWHEAYKLTLTATTNRAD